MAYDSDHYIVMAYDSAHYLVMACDSAHYLVMTYASDHYLVMAYASDHYLTTPHASTDCLMLQTLSVNIFQHVFYVTPEYRATYNTPVQICYAFSYWAHQWLQHVTQQLQVGLKARVNFNITTYIMTMQNYDAPKPVNSALRLWTYAYPIQSVPAMLLIANHNQTIQACIVWSHMTNDYGIKATTPLNHTFAEESHALRNKSRQAII